MEEQKGGIVTSLLHRDKKEFSSLFEKYHASLFRFAQTYVCCSSQSEDIVQEVFIKLWENPDIRIKSSVRSYLFFMVRNKCIDYLRSVHVEDENHKLLMESMIISDSIDIDFCDEAKEKIGKAIAELPSQCRQVYNMHIFHGLKNVEIAEELGLSESSVKVQIYRAKKSLREKLYSVRHMFILFSHLVQRS